ncbi:hypothetical protein V3589_03115 [Sinorhizobium fredii]|uniref:hypothetical protein n=1 Tax=Rhizobium fredii TaxID=380 RepID=UPI00309DD062
MEKALESDLGNERVSEATSEEPRRKRGRPKGLPKTGGRAKGGKNWSNEEIRSALLGKSEAIETLADICAGRLIRVSGPTGKQMDVYPSMQERLKAAELVLKKVVPDLQSQSVELTGANGKDLYPSEQQDARQMSRAILAVLGEAVLDDAPEPEPMPLGKHQLTAQHFEEVDEVDALDLSDEPPVGERILVGDHGCWFEKTPDGRWRSMHADGTLHRYCKSRAEAERQASELTW